MGYRKVTGVLNEIGPGQSNQRHNVAAHSHIKIGEDTYRNPKMTLPMRSIVKDAIGEEAEVWMASMDNRIVAIKAGSGEPCYQAAHGFAVLIRALIGLGVLVLLLKAAFALGGYLSRQNAPLSEEIWAWGFVAVPAFITLIFLYNHTGAWFKSRAARKAFLREYPQAVKV